jgi:hypothetical protein
MSEFQPTLPTEELTSVGRLPSTVAKSRFHSLTNLAGPDSGSMSVNAVLASLQNPNVYQSMLSRCRGEVVGRMLRADVFLKFL